MDGRWSLDALYKGYDDPAFSADAERMKALNAEYDAFSNNLSCGEPKEILKQALAMQEELLALMTRLYSFAGLRAAADARDEESAAWSGRLLLLTATLPLRMPACASLSPCCRIWTH